MTSLRMVLLGDVASLQAGVGFPPDLQGRPVGDYPLAKVGDISRGGRSGEPVLSSATHYVDVIDLVRLRAKPVPAGSILFAKIGEAISSNHRVIAGCDMLIDNNAMAAIPGPEIFSQYLFHYLRTIDFYRMTSSTTVPALRKSELEKIRVPLPVLPNQYRMVRILDVADALRAKRRNALAQLDALIQTIFLDLLGNPATNPKGWPTKSIGDAMSEVYRYPTYYDITYVEDGVPEIRGELLQEDGGIVTDKSRLRYISPGAALFGAWRIRNPLCSPRFRVETGDVPVSGRALEGHGFASLPLAGPPLLMPRTGVGRISMCWKEPHPISPSTSARFPRTVLDEGDLVMSVRGTVGKVAVVPHALAGANMTANLLRMAPHRKLLIPVFAWHFMQTGWFKSQLAGACSSTTILTIKAPDLKRLEIPLPPLDLQQSFARRVAAIDQLKASHRASLAELDALFASLQHRAFRGEL